MWAFEVGDGALERIEIEPPRPGAGEALVAVAASSVNNADVQRLGGTYATDSDAARVIAGMDVAGTVVELGDSDGELELGDRVMSRAAGSWAEQTTIRTADAVGLPESWSFAEGAAAITGLLTEWHAIRRAGRLSAGERVLVRGASSGVGMAAVEIAELLGAGEVVAGVRSARSEQRLRDRGADSVLVEAGGAIAAAAGSAGFDLIVDHVCGELFGEACAALGVGGRIVDVGRLGGKHGSLDLDDLARKRAEVIGVSFRTRSAEQVAEIAAGVRAELSEPIAAGRLKPPIDSRYPLERAPEALEHLRGQRHSGKVVLVAAG